ncbi:hypothetical protein BDV96DRAFT_205658 [Lophiotrema nucula]|uniref:Uncharacterized protein n=1 Tax=Lophiotrema nucula TaxID=690887 RepID=A0A6A5ZPM3_9PLEO|nr:hypothetical protein BDV96DRAFT_205658 [Lophiotrema nucula]
MQEFCLSRRCLFFTSREYTLSCVNGLYVEPIVNARPDPRWQVAAVFIDRILRPAAGEGFIACFYADLVSLYLVRRLAYKGDILRAFQGMASALAPYPGEIWWGIPHCYFRYSLCWMDHDSSVRRSSFPSWSWAGWMPTEGAPPRLGRHAFPDGFDGRRQIPWNCLKAITSSRLTTHRTNPVKNMPRSRTGCKPHTQFSRSGRCSLASMLQYLSVWL